MATITRQTHSCDSCGKTVDKKSDVRQFKILVARKPAPYRDSHVDVRTDLCDDCEPRFVAAITPFFGDGDKLAELRRES